MADRLRGLAAASGDSLDASRIPCHLSIGVAVRPPWGASAPQFVEAADHALLTAKRRGRDRVVLDPSSAPHGARPGGAPV
jgi:PleD family two-component response regulator